MHKAKQVKKIRSRELVKPLALMTKSELGLYIDKLKHEMRVLKSQGRSRFPQKQKIKQALMVYVKFLVKTDNQTEKRKWD